LFRVYLVISAKEKCLFFIIFITNIQKIKIKVKLNELNLV
jgi:hypothetical protein